VKSAPQPLARPNCHAIMTLRRRSRASGDFRFRDDDMKLSCLRFIMSARRRMRWRSQRRFRRCHHSRLRGGAQQGFGASPSVRSKSGILVAALDARWRGNVEGIAHERPWRLSTMLSENTILTEIHRNLPAQRRSANRAVTPRRIHRA